MPFALKCSVSLLTLSAALCGCANLDVKLSDFMSPDHAPASAQLPAGYQIENHVIRANGQSIGLTYARHAASRVVILYCGGDAFHRSIEGGLALQALALTADVVVFDYPGYGDSTGVPNTTAILETALAVYDHVFNLGAALGKRRVLYGFSLGGMVVAQLAQDRPADGIILESTVPSVERWARSQILTALRPVVNLRIEPQLSGLNTVAALDQFRGPIFILTSRADHRVPASLSYYMERELRRAERRVRLVEFPGREHGAIMLAPAFQNTLREFFDRIRIRS